MHVRRLRPADDADFARFPRRAARAREDEWQEGGGEGRGAGTFPRLSGGGRP